MEEGEFSGALMVCVEKARELQVSCGCCFFLLLLSFPMARSEGREARVPNMYLLLSLLSLSLSRTLSRARPFLPP